MVLKPHKMFVAINGNYEDYINHEKIFCKMSHKNSKISNGM